MSGIVRSICAAMYVSILAASTVSAASSMPEREPGLWEITIKQDSAMAKMMAEAFEALKNLPPEQRKQMEAVMGNSGISIAQPNVIRECVTPEKAKAELRPAIDDPDMKCSKMDWKGSREGGTFSMTCTNPEGKWTVSGRVWDATPKSYKSTMTMKGKVNGEDFVNEISHEAKWVSADCTGVTTR